MTEAVDQRRRERRPDIDARRPDRPARGVLPSVRDQNALIAVAIEAAAGRQALIDGVARVAGYGGGDSVSARALEAQARILNVKLCRMIEALDAVVAAAGGSAGDAARAALAREAGECLAWIDGLDEMAGAVERWIGQQAAAHGVRPDDWRAPERVRLGLTARDGGAAYPAATTTALEGPA